MSVCNLQAPFGDALSTYQNGGSQFQQVNCAASNYEHNNCDAAVVTENFPMTEANHGELNQDYSMQSAAAGSNEDGLSVHSSSSRTAP